MKRIGHRIFLLLSSVRVKSFVNASGCLFVRQENESRVFCLSLTGWIVSIGAADERLRPFEFCTEIWFSPGIHVVQWAVFFIRGNVSQTLAAYNAATPAMCQPFFFVIKFDTKKTSNFGHNKIFPQIVSKKNKSKKKQKAKKKKQMEKEFIRKSFPRESVFFSKWKIFRDFSRHEYRTMIVGEGQKMNWKNGPFCLRCFSHSHVSYGENASPDQRGKVNLPARRGAPQ